MKLDDINKQINSGSISRLLEDKFGVKINFEKLSKAQLLKLRENLQKAHRQTVKSVPFNSGHRNPEYLEQIALLEAVELRINEIEEAAKWKQGYSASGHPAGYKHKDGTVGPIGGTFTYDDNYGEVKKVPVHKYRDTFDPLAGRDKTKLSTAGKPLLKKNAERNLKNAIKNAKGYHGPVQNIAEEKAEDNMKKPQHPQPNFSGNQSSALLKLVGKDNINKAKQAIRLAAQEKPIPGNLVKGFKPIIDILLDILQGGSSYVNQLQALDKKAAHAAHLDENKRYRRLLREGEMEKAQLVMAVKDMVDRVQGMVEDLNKMKVEDLVALTDKMRDEFGQDSASTFMNSAGTTLSTAIDTLTNARAELDNAALGLTGEGGMPAEQPAMSPEVPGAEAGAEMPDMELPTDAEAELPLGDEMGRAKRESREYGKKKILESSRFLGKLAQ